MSGTRLRKYLELSRQDRRLVIKAWFLILWKYCELTLKSRRNVASEIRRAASGHRTPVDSDIVLRARRRLVLLDKAARHHLVPANCLTRSLAGKTFLAGDGIDASLCIGVARGSAHQLLAHAWLEIDGAVVNDHEDVASRFSPIGNIADSSQDAVWQ